MTGLHVTVPIACWRKGLAREYLETEEIPPPATCYGFLLSLVGETDRRRHIGCRVTAGLLGGTTKSVVLRTMWRVKKTPLGSAGNTRPDYQQLLTGAFADSPFIELVLWLDSAAETAPAPRLEERVRAALDRNSRGALGRFGGLSLGESTHLVDSVSLFTPQLLASLLDRPYRIFLQDDCGRMTLPVWVDHVGSSNTRYVVGDLVLGKLESPPFAKLHAIDPRIM
jgi:CRISPR-associated protein Cas5t